MPDELNILNLPTEETSVATKEILDGTKTVLSNTKTTLDNTNTTLGQTKQSLDTTNTTLSTKLDAVVTALGQLTSGVTSVNGKTGVVVLNKTDIGLSNVDNTADINKPISTATQTALNTKIDKVSTTNRVYGTDASGNQTTYDKESFGQVDDVKVDGTSVVTNKTANISFTTLEKIANKVTTLSQTSTDTQYPSAKTTYDHYKENSDRITLLEGRGRFLSLWNSDTGLPTTNPPELPYTYKSGDYYIIGTVTSGAIHYKPSGSIYTGAASGTIETNVIMINDVYLYDGTNWILQKNEQREITIASVVGLQSALDSKGTLAGNNGWTGTNTFTDFTKIVDGSTTTTLKAQLDLKATASDLTSHINNTNNPHSVTKAQVGLGNVDNTSDLSKPISTLTQAALNLKANISTISNEYDSTLTYKLGAMVIHNSQLYKAKTNISSPETWTPAHWDSTSIVNELPMIYKL